MRRGRGRRQPQDMTQGPQWGIAGANPPGMAALHPDPTRVAMRAVRHSQPVADSEAATVVAAASGACREAGSCNNGHSQMVAEKQSDPECPQIVAEHSQEVADRTARDPGSDSAPEAPGPHCADKLHYVN